MSKAIEKNDMKNLISIFEYAGKLKTINRKGWITHFGMKDPESVADHSFRTALMGIILSDMKGLKTEKVVKMCLLHDLHESIIGDLDSEDKKKLTKEYLDKLERDSIEKILEDFPSKIKKSYSKIWKELMGGKTEEAKLVWQLDKMELGIQTYDYSKKIKNADKMKDFIKYTNKNIFDKDLKELFKRSKK